MPNCSDWAPRPLLWFIVMNLKWFWFTNIYTTVRTTLAGGHLSWSAGLKHSVPREGEHLYACNMKVADCLNGVVGNSDVLLWPSETMTTGEKWLIRSGMCRKCTSCSRLELMIQTWGRCQIVNNLMCNIKWSKCLWRNGWCCKTY